ncbi:response regulator [Paenibacillus sp. L3-i20]|uniref:response regulator n=1 Tax=Paenibacillus sp. L3-i20 TaxID=2905833 RepID=UPI001EDD2FB2|nr:response regulator [Paenibacillus sp. L3-i20]GKU77430.1 hypothetical protein L3i20_v218270 [Paenibacillus sp. L3-i20]
MRKFKRSYTKKLVFLMLITIVVAFFLTGYTVLSQTNKIIKNEIESRIKLQSNMLADKMNVFFNQKGLLIQEISTNQAVLRYLKTASSREEASSNPDYDDVTMALDAIKELDANVGLVWIGSKRGNFVIGNGGAFTSSDFQFQERPWYKDALEEENVLFTEPYVDYITGKMVISGTLKIEEDGHVLGFVAIDLSLDNIPGILESYQIGQTGYPILLSKDGTIMYHANQEMVVKQKLTEQPGKLGHIAERMVAGESGLQVVSINDRKEYIGYAPIPYSGWSVAAVLPTKEALKQLSSVVSLSVGIYVAATVILVSLLYLLLRNLLNTQKRIQRVLRRAKDEAEEASKAKTLFLARMSHEIRTPLNGIIGLSQLMQKTKLSGRQQDFQEKILSSSNVLLRLINEILDFSKIEAGKLEIEKVSFYIEEVVRRVSDMLGVYLGGNQIEVIMDTSPNVNVELLGDPHRLEQILLNLCSNAIKFTEHGFVALSIKLESQGPAEMRIRFKVEDTGIGMSAEQIDHLFEPFTQGDGSTSRRFGGTGLGLVISQNLIEMMGGRLELSSELGKGSTFSFALSFEVIDMRNRLNFHLSKGYESLPVIVVEDHERMRDHIVRLLRSFALAPVSVSTWEQLFRRLERQAQSGVQKYKLILVDMEADDMYGAEALSRLQSLAGSSGITIALTTEYGRDEFATIEERDQPHAVLTKPINRINLYKVVQAALEQGGTRHVATPEKKLKEEIVISGSKGKILLAEDHEINQKVAMELLIGLNYSVTVARNGKEVLQKLSTDRWDLILMDVHMPEMDGCEATRLIRQDKRYDRMPIVAMTASIIAEEHDNCYRSGMNDVMTKPIDMKEVVEMLDHYIPVPYLDLNSALDRVAGKWHIYEHILITFEREYSDFCDRLNEALKDGEYSRAARLIHTLSGVAGNLSAERLFATSKKLEFMLLLTAESTEYQECVRSVQQQLDEVITLIRRWKSIKALKSEG